MTDIIATAAPAALAKTFDPAAIEAKWYAHWEREGLFRPHRPDAPPFTIVNPPPNVTGSLHIGHALDNTLQDIVVRYERLRGKDALWVVGTDHAGIATQMVVERQLEARQDSRANYSRDEFIAKVWEWKAESGGTITTQLRRLGCSMDWSREQFTMDDHFSRAVTKVFVDLYNEGLIYRDKRLVNWDPKLKTAISDLEVETRQVQGHFWHIRYPLADGVRLASGADHIVVATTRPETMLADMAVAVNAADARYQSVIGAFVTLPITGRRIPIVADDHADPALGSGAVKITPGHDFNDFEVGKRAGFAPADMLNMFDAEANVVQVSDKLIPTDFFKLIALDMHSQENGKISVGLERSEARELVLQHLRNNELLELVEERSIQTPFGDRSGVVVEPWLTDQWYVNAAELAKAPMAAVRDGRIEIVPKSWEKTFFNWMENIQPWCVSRQLWWGHQIPAWYGPAKGSRGEVNTTMDVSFQADPPNLYVITDAKFVPEKVFVTTDETRLLALAQAYYGDDFQVEVSNIPTWTSDPFKVILYRDYDVLDTWFSSALWPFATLGWPEDTNPPSPSGEGPGVGVGALDQAPRSGHAPTPTPPLKGRGLDTPSLLARHYPNDLSIAGFDILFFWCARMAMQGMHFMDDVPWRRLYLHGLVRAADGQKMSKSKGNVVDPLVLIDRYGADALRFFMAAMESQGRDVKMDERRVEGYRNFATKLWNAARFCQANGVGASTSLAAPTATLAVNQWIIGEVVETLAQLDKAMADLRFDAAANAIYHFVWDRFCDWYIELIKPLPTTEEAGELYNEGWQEHRKVAGWVLDQILVMLHPIMPFVTEELWGELGPRDNELIVARWPLPDVAIDQAVVSDIEWVIQVVSAVRALRTDLNIPLNVRPKIHVPPNSEIPIFRDLAFAGMICRVGRLNGFTDEPAPEGASALLVVRDVTFVLPLEGIIDVAAEKVRLTKALETATKEAKSFEGRLNNPAFVAKAKPEAVDKARADHAAHAAEAERLAAALARLG